MTTKQTTAVIAGITPDHCIPAGVVLSRTGKYTFTGEGELAIADVCQMVPIPKGAQIIDVILQWNACNTNCDATVGDGSDADGWILKQDVDAAGRAHAGSSAAAYFIGKEYTANDTIDITIATAATDAGDEITCIVLYKVEGAIDDET